MQQVPNMQQYYTVPQLEYNASSSRSSAYDAYYSPTFASTQSPQTPQSASGGSRLSRPPASPPGTAYRARSATPLWKVDSHDALASGTPGSPPASIVDYDSKALMKSWARYRCVYGPVLALFLITAGLWGFAIFVQTRSANKLEITGSWYTKFVDSNPKISIFVNTLGAAALGALFSYAFARALANYARYRLIKGNPMTLLSISALQSAQTGAFAWVPANSIWFWLTLAVWLSLLTLTPAVNTVLFPTSHIITRDLGSRDEIDLTSPGFGKFWDFAIASYPNCAWTDRNGSCPAGTHFASTSRAGQAAFETNQLNLISYSRIGRLTFNGSTRSILPSTRRDFGNSESLFVKLADTKRNYSIAADLQGYDTKVSCQITATSPIRSNGSIACNPSTPIRSSSRESNPDLNMLAAYCNDTQNLGSYLFYAKFHGSYSHNDQAGGNANMLCTLTPRIAVQSAVYTSIDDSTTVRKSPSRSLSTLQAIAFERRILETIVDMAVRFGQNSFDNLFAEMLVTLTTSYYGGGPESWPVVLEEVLAGMFAYLGTHQRILLEDRLDAYRVRTAEPSALTLSRSAVIQYRAPAFSTSWTTFVFLVPVTVLACVGILMGLQGARLRSLPYFDGLHPISLIIAASEGDLDMSAAAKAGAAPDDKQVLDTAVRLEKTVNGYGLVRF